MRLGNGGRPAELDRTEKIEKKLLTPGPAASK
jgi:hypothetical protein